MTSPAPPVAKEARKRKRALDFELLDKFFESEPNDYENAWKALRDRAREIKITGPMPVVSLKLSGRLGRDMYLRYQLAPTSLVFYGALNLFNLREGFDFLWGNTPSLPVPQYLHDNIARIYAVSQSGRQTSNEAFVRTIIDQFLSPASTKATGRSGSSAKLQKKSLAILPMHNLPPLKHPGILIRVP